MSQQASIPTLISDLDAKGLLGPNWGKRIEAAKKLGELRAVQAVGPLTARINERKHDDFCRTAVEALGKIGSAEAVVELVRWLSDPTRRDVQATAVIALKQIGGEAAIQALAQVSSDTARRQVVLQGLRDDLRGASRLMQPDWDRRVVAVRALAILRATEAVDDMTAEISKHKEPRLWNAVIPALAQIGDDRAVTALINGWEWADATQGNVIRQMLTELGTPRTDQPLLDALHHKAPPRARKCLEVIGSNRYLTAPHGSVGESRRHDASTGQGAIDTSWRTGCVRPVQGTQS